MSPKNGQIFGRAGKEEVVGEGTRDRRRNWERNVVLKACFLISMLFRQCEVTLGTRVSNLTLPTTFFRSVFVFNK